MNKHFFQFLSLRLILLMVSAESMNGQSVFQKSYKSNVGTAGTIGISLQPTSDQGFIIAGFSEVNGLLYDNDITVIRTDSLGDTLWTKNYGGPNDDRGHNIKQTHDGGFIITGITRDSTTSIIQPFLLRINSIGDTVWTRRYNTSDTWRSYSVAETHDYGLIISGHGQDMGGFGLIRTDSSGNILWSYNYGGPGPEEGRYVVQTPDKGFIMVGYAHSSIFQDGDMAVIKTDSLGIIQWSNRYDTNMGDIALFIKGTSDGGYIISAGRVQNSIQIYKLDSSGNVMWSRVFENTGFIQGDNIYELNDGGYIIAAGRSPFGSGYGDAALIKTDSAGNLIWSKVYGYLWNGTTTSVAPAADGGFLITGYGTSQLSSHLYMIKTDSLGYSGCIESVAPTISYLESINIIPLNFAYYASTVMSNDPEFTITNGGTLSTNCVLGLDEHHSNPTILITPNPTTGVFRIDFSTLIRSGLIEVYSAAGKKVFQEQILGQSSSAIELNTNPGLYIIVVRNNDSIYHGKIIVQGKR